MPDLTDMPDLNFLGLTSTDGHLMQSKPVHNSTIGQTSVRGIPQF